MEQWAHPTFGTRFYKVFGRQCEAIEAASVDPSLKVFAFEVDTGGKRQFVACHPERLWAFYKGDNRYFIHLTEAFFGRGFGKPRFLQCRNLEFWVFSSSYYVFLLSNLKSNLSPFKNLLFLQYFNWTLGILTILQPLLCISPFVWVNICTLFSKLCRNLEFFAWVLSYFLEAWVFSSLSFFQTVKKKPAVKCKFWLHWVFFTELWNRTTVTNTYIKKSMENIWSIVF